MNLELPGDQLRTAQHPETEACTLVPGMEHDFRPNHYQHYGVPHVSWVCVWCHGVACGEYLQPDPCMEIYHHETPHKSRSGITWAVGRSRSDGVTA